MLRQAYDGSRGTTRTASSECSATSSRCSNTSQGTYTERDVNTPRPQGQGVLITAYVKDDASTRNQLGPGHELLQAALPLGHRRAAIVRQCRCS